jgi:hypothetical protein
MGVWCDLCWRSLEASGEPYLVAAWPVLWRHGVGTFGTATTCQAWAPLLGEWFLSFGVVATRPVIPGPVAFAVCSSCSLTGVEGRDLGGENHGPILS